MGTVTDYDFVFVEPCQIIGGGSRWSWIECIVSDCQLFMNGIQANGGGGNLAFPILICTGIDLVSDLYVGDTYYISGNAFDQSQAAAEFIEHFFDGVSQQIPRIIWDAVRNGLTHCFLPKGMSHAGSDLHFTFTAGPASGASLLWRSGSAGRIILDVGSLFAAFQLAVDRYHGELQTDPAVQHRFRVAWESIENHVRVAQGPYATEMDLIFSPSWTGQLPLFDPAQQLP
jgi:hypothetical protein